jgi:HlyD family secretion protein
MSRRAIVAVTALAAVVVGVVGWFVFSGPALPAGFSRGNGRLEANELYIAAKYPGRIKEVLFKEGDTVEEGQVVATMDTSALEAELRSAEAKVVEARDNRNYGLAQVDVKKADFEFSNKQYSRSRQLVQRGAVSEQEAEIDFARLGMTKAELIGAQAQAVRTLSAIDAAIAEADRLKAEIHDAILVAPIRARVETRLAEPGEVLPAGGRVYSLVDLSDVYMYIFLPERTTGKVALGAEARIVLDAAPQYPVRAFVSYVSPMAQFTPKTVETAEERHNLTFRVKLQVDKTRLRQFESLVKAGIPGMGYVRLDKDVEWPADLRPKATVPQNIWNVASSGAPS